MPTSSPTPTWSAAKHSVKFGADVRLNDVTNNAAFDSKGTFTFDNLQGYMNNNSFGVAQALQTAELPVHQWQSFFFVQDDFRPSELTLNLGLRYEWSDVPLGMFGYDRSAGARRPWSRSGAGGHEKLGAASGLCVSPNINNGFPAMARPSSAAAGGSATT